MRFRTPRTMKRVRATKTQRHKDKIRALVAISGELFMLFSQRAGNNEKQAEMNRLTD
jgi:hypothetical protein